MSKVGIEALIGVGVCSYIFKQLARIDEIPLGLDRIIFDLWRDDIVGEFGVVDALIITFDVVGEVFADKAIKQGAKYILLKIPAIDSATNLICNLPNLAL